MADSAPNFKVGEIFEDSELHAVEYAGTIKAGDPLKITGRNAEGLAKVQKQTTTLKVRYCAVYDGESGLITDALFKGTTKLKAAVKWGAGADIGALAGEFRVFTDSTSSEPCGFSYGAEAANDDTGLVYFHGSVN